MSELKLAIVVPSGVVLFVKFLLDKGGHVLNIKGKRENGTA